MSSIMPQHDDIVASIEAMSLQEENGYQTDASLYQSEPQQEVFSVSNGPLTAAAEPTDAECRRKMTEWCFQVVDYCAFSRETVSISMSYLDRFCMTPQGAVARNDRKVYQLAAMTCLYTAVKVHEPEAMEPKTISGLSRGAYTEHQVQDMEQTILQALSWRMNPPTAQTFIDHLVALLPPGNDIEGVVELAKFQAELAVSQVDLVGVKPSVIAHAALANTLESSHSLSFAKICNVVDMDQASAVQEELYRLLNNAAGLKMSPKAAAAVNKSNNKYSSTGMVDTSPRCIASQ